MYNFFKNLFKIFIFFNSFYLYCFLFIINLFIKVRIGSLKIGHIGHLSLNIELYLQEKKISNKKSFDLFIKKNEEICNNYLYTLVKELFVINIYSGIFIINSKFKIFEVIVRENSQKKDNDRDLLFLLENKQIELKPSKTQINKCQNFLESIGVNFKENQKIVTIIVRDKAYGLKYKKRDESYKDY